jgi:hypothetical protein
MPAPKPRSTWLFDGILTGAIGAAATTALLAAFGQKKEGSPWTPFNAIAHMLYGPEAAGADGFVPRETLTGLGLNATAIVTWGALYEMLAGKVAFPESLLTGAAASGVIYLLDYHVFPPKLRPGFEKRLGNDAVVAAYILLALSLGLSPLWKKPEPRDGAAPADV